MPASDHWKIRIFIVDVQVGYTNPSAWIQKDSKWTIEYLEGGLIPT